MNPNAQLEQMVAEADKRPRARQTAHHDRGDWAVNLLKLAHEHASIAQEDQPEHETRADEIQEGLRYGHYAVLNFPHITNELRLGNDCAFLLPLSECLRQHTIMVTGALIAMLACLWPGQAEEHTQAILETLAKARSDRASGEGRIDQIIADGVEEIRRRLVGRDRPE